MNAYPVKTEYDSPPSFLQLPDGRTIAYRLLEGHLPGVVFFGGFRSDMTGSKATALAEYCRQRQQRMVRFDYTGHGASSGDFMQGSIGAWKNDALSILDHIAPGPNLLVGSSMGAWLMALAALDRPQQVAGMLGIASAPDFTEKLIWHPSGEAQKKEWRDNGVVYAPSCYGEEPYPITRLLIEEARQHLMMDKPIPIAGPIRLMHGIADRDVPWQLAVEWMQHMASTDSSIELIKDGDHRLSAPKHLEILCRIAGNMLDTV